MLRAPDSPRTFTCRYSQVSKCRASWTCCRCLCLQQIVNKKTLPWVPKARKSGRWASHIPSAAAVNWDHPVHTVTCTLQFPLQQSQLSDTKSSFNPFLSDQANFIKRWGKQKFPALPLSGLLFAAGLRGDWLRGSNVLLNSDKAGVLSGVAEGGSGSFIMSTSLLNDRHQRQCTAGQSLTCTKQSSAVVNSFLFSPAPHCASHKPLSSSFAMWFFCVLSQNVTDLPECRSYVSCNALCAKKWHWILRFFSY